MRVTIGYFADGPWSHEAFKLIKNNPEFAIQFICIRNDSEDKKLQAYALTYNIPCYRHPDINSKEFHNMITPYQCDLFVSMSFNQIFKPATFNLPKYKTINCHAGKLPFYRGRNILNWALINDEREFGITVHYVDEGIDTGNIILQRIYSITDEDTYATLLERAYVECARVLYDALLIFTSPSPPQTLMQTDIHPTGFYCSQRKTGDEIINWQQNSRDLFNFIRAISPPGPSARTKCRDYEVRIQKANYLKNAPTYKGVPGAVLLKKSNGSLIVKTMDSFIEITEYECDINIKTGDRFETK